MDVKNFTSDDLVAIVFALFYNLNLRVYDNGMSIADNVMKQLTE